MKEMRKEIEYKGNTYNLVFNRQRAIESLSYVPIKISNDAGWVMEDANDYSDDWQFYFEPSMLNSHNTFYGVHILEVLGLDNTPLTSAELSNINLSFEINNPSLGLALFNIGNIGEGLEYLNPNIFNRL